MSKGKGMVPFGLFGLLFMMSLFLRSSPAVIANDLMAEFNILPVTMGLMASVYFWAYGLVQIPVGYLSDRIGVRSTVVIFALLGVIGTFSFAFAQNVQMATWSRLVFGIGTAGIWVPALKYLSVFYKPGEFASLSSLLSSIGSCGMILSSFPLAVLVERTNWRFPFSLTSAILLLLVVGAWFLIANTTTLQANVSQEGRAKLNFKDYFVKYSRVLVFFFWSFLVYGFIFSFQGLWGVPYLQDVFALDRQTAGVILMFFSFGIIVGGPFWGLLSDRYLRVRKPVLYLGTTGLLVTALVFYFLGHFPGVFWFSLMYFCLSFFGSVFLINLTCVKEYLPLEITGTVMGLLNTLMIMSVGFFQNVTGYYINYFFKIADAVVAYKIIFLIYCTGVAIAFILTFFMPETFAGKLRKEVGDVAISDGR